jgi:TFIIF-interacting CTD phosphatase-like protein
MAKTIMIDNTADAFGLNPRNFFCSSSHIAYSEAENGILIRPFLNNSADMELLHCIPFLVALRCIEDVRSVLSLRRQ